MSDEKKYKSNKNNNEDKIPGNSINGNIKREDNSNKSKGKKKYSTQKIKDLIKYWRNRTFVEKHDIILIFTNVILAAGSIASVILIYCMTSQQNDISGKLLDAQIKRDSIDNARDSVLRKRENDFFFITNRANISIEVISLDFKPNEECRLNWQMTNFGNTTAFNTRAKVSRFYDPMTESKFDSLTEILPYSGNNIGSKESHPTNMSRLKVVTPAEYNAFIERRLELKFFIFVCYETLDSNKVTYVNFRIITEPKGYIIVEVQEYTGGN
jgi:hypothetical protein